MTQTLTRYEGNYLITRTTTNTQEYGGDGQQVRDPDLRTATSPQVGINPITKTTYYLRSSVLGGQTVTEYDATGARQKSYSYLGGEVLSETTKGMRRAQ